MDINKTNRTQLKGYFAKNCIPTEGQFAELIDGMLNQKEDGIAKPAGDPLSIEAAGDAQSLKKAINVYEKFADANPAWTLLLNPRTDPTQASSARPGFCVADGAGNTRLFLDKGTGNLGVGTITPVARLDIAQSKRTGTHPSAAKALYVSGDFGDVDGAEFRKSDGTQGIGIGATTLYAAGSDTNQDLNLKAKGTGQVKVVGSVQVAGGNLKVDGVITPSTGNKESSGILFSKDPGGGSGDAAWLRYYVRTAGTENCILEIGVSNDREDHIALMPGGGVGIGTTAPIARLDVAQSARTGTQPGAVKGLYVTGEFGDADGAEFRKSDGSQGIGIGANTVYAAGSGANQDLNLKAKGTGQVVAASELAIRGNTILGQATAGTRFVLHPRSATSGDFLQITADDASGNWDWGKGLTLVRATGNVGIGTTAPNGKLDVANLVRLGFDEGDSGSRSISFARDSGDEGNAGKIAYKGFGDGTALHIVGAGSSGTTRKVRLHDNVEVTGTLKVAGGSNLISVQTFRKVVKNAGKDQPGQWSVDYSGFVEVYTAFAVLQGHSLWDQTTVSFSSAGYHAKGDGNIPQHVFVNVSAFSTTRASGNAYCSESNADSESDNCVLFTLVVMGRTA